MMSRLIKSHRIEVHVRYVSMHRRSVCVLIYGHGHGIICLQNKVPAVTLSTSAVMVALGQCNGFAWCPSLPFLWA